MCPRVEEGERGGSGSDEQAWAKMERAANAESSFSGGARNGILQKRESSSHTTRGSIAFPSIKSCHYFAAEGLEGHNNNNNNNMNMNDPVLVLEDPTSKLDDNQTRGEKAPSGQILSMVGTGRHRD